MASSHTDASTPSRSNCNALPRLKLCYLNRAKLFSVPLSQLSFSKLLSLVAQAFPETQNGSRSAESFRRATPSGGPQYPHAATHIELSYDDEDGDSIIIDSDESFSLAALSCQKAHMGVLKVHIRPRTDQSIPSVDITNGSSSGGRRPGIPCRHFQAGLCRFGSSCRFLHHNASGNKRTSRKPGMLLDGFEVEEWLMAQKNASEHENINYLSSKEGCESLMQILNHPHLSQTAIHQLIDLLTRPKFRTSLLKQATDKIYSALLGSQFLVALHSHIRATVKPVLECIEPYVFLCEEIMGRTSNGWKDVPLDELKTLADDVDKASAMELRYTLDRLFDHRAKKKRMEAVNEEMGVQE